MNNEYRFTDWFVHNWSRAALPLAIVLLLLSPLLLDTLGVAAFLVYLQLPIYMIHQYEEHAHGAFKETANKMLGRGVDLLTDTNILWINVSFVWVTDLLALYAARYVDLAPGLIAPYGTVLNGVFHLAIALRRRGYNPGLWTALGLFLPVGGYSIYAISTAAGASPTDHALGLAGGIALHLVAFGIIALDTRRRARTEAAVVG